MAGSSSTGRILVVGASNTDLVCTTERLPQPGETLASTTFSIYPGGKAANQAVAASRAGATVGFVGCFGGDAYGKSRRQEMTAEGIDLTYALTIDDETSGLALIAVDPDGENLIITVGGANDRLDVDQLRPALDDGTSDVVLLPNEAAPAVVELSLTGAGPATTILNAAPYVAELRELAPLANILVCNEVEASQFLGNDVAPATAERAVQDLASLAGGRAVITLGAAGAVGWDGQATHTVPAIPVDVVDTTGAGDAFCGAFAAWLARGSTFVEALRAGSAAGSLATTRAGAQPSLPHVDEILARL